LIGLALRHYSIAFCFFQSSWRATTRLGSGVCWKLYILPKLFQHGHFHLQKDGWIQNKGVQSQPLIMLLLPHLSPPIHPDETTAEIPSFHPAPGERVGLQNGLFLSPKPRKRSAWVLHLFATLLR